MDQRFRSVALIQQSGETPARFFLRWNDEDSKFEFVVGDRIDKESFRETVTREVAWQLDLDRKRDFLVANMAQLNMEYVEVSPFDQSQTHVAVAFYNVHVYRKQVLQTLNDDTDSKWVSSKEICDGQTTDGEMIDPQVVEWINRWRIIEPWF